MRLRNWLSGFGNPLDWTPIDRGLFLAVLLASSFLAGVVGLGLCLQILDFANTPYDRSVLEVIFWEHVVAFSLVTLLAIALISKRKRQTNSRLVFILGALYAYHLPTVFWAFGYATLPGHLMLLFGVIPLFVLLLDKAVAWASSTLLVSGTLLLIVCERLGVLSYAPIFRTSYFESGQLDSIFFYAAYLTIALVSSLCCAVYVYIIHRWRRREAETESLARLLRSAFGRYFSPQVMDTILSDPASMDLGGVRRNVTIMFTDLRGFTSLSERMPPESVVKLLNIYFERMLRIIDRHSGTVVEIEGDALLVIFGAPQSMPNRKQVAVACAIEMQNAMQAVNDAALAEALPRLEMGIGINDDDVIVGNIGSTNRSKYSVIGAGVNMASRIESYTTGGQVLVSSSIYNSEKESLRIDGEMEIVPKGSDTRLRIYSVGGIGGEFNLALDSGQSALIKLSRRVPVTCRVIVDKMESAEAIAGDILELSGEGAVLGCAAALDLMMDMSIRLRDVGPTLESKAVYGKVVGSHGGGAGSYIIRFTALVPEISAYFQAHQMFGVENAIPVTGERS